MAFDDSVFPITEGYGSVGGPGFSSLITRTDAGTEEVTSSWQAPLKQYDLETGLRGDSEAYTVYNWFIAHRGSAIGFLFLDLNDHASTSDGKVLADPGGTADPANTDQLIGTGDGVTTRFQLVKNYTVGTLTTTWPVVKPKSGTVICSINDASETGFTVDTTTGIVTFNTAPGNGLAVKAGYEFYVPVRFGEEVDKFLGIEKSNFSSSEIASLPLVEIRSAPSYSERHVFTGSKDWGSVSANISTNLNNGGFQSFDPQSAGLKIMLPNPDDMPATGLGFFVFQNKSATYSLTIAEQDGTPLTGNSSIGTSSFGEIVLLLQINSRIWQMIV